MRNQTLEEMPIKQKLTSNIGNCKRITAMRSIRKVNGKQIIIVRIKCKRRNLIFLSLHGFTSIWDGILCASLITMMLLTCVLEFHQQQSLHKLNTTSQKVYLRYFGVFFFAKIIFIFVLEKSLPLEGLCSCLTLLYH